MIDELKMGKWIINGDAGTGKTEMFYQLLSSLQGINEENYLVIVGNTRNQMEAEKRVPGINITNIFAFCARIAKDYGVYGLNASSIHEIVSSVYKNLSKDSLRSLHRKYKYLIVDNYECLTPESGRILKNIGFENYVFFGDPKACMTGLEQFDISDGAKVITLSENFRLNKSILNVANKVIKNSLEEDNMKHENVTLMRNSGSFGEAEWIAQLCREIKGTTGILCRTNKILSSVAESLKFYNIDFNILTSVYDNEFMKNLISVINVIFFIKEGETNFTFVYEEDINNALKVFKIQTRRKNKLVEQVNNGEGVDKFFMEYPEVFNKIQEIREANGVKEKITLIMKLFFERIDYKILDMIPDKVKDEYDVLLRFTTIETDNSSSITLATIHQARSCQFDNVIIPSLNEGNFPNYNAISEGTILEERKLFYIGATRGKKLFLSYFLEKIKNSFGPSRFLQVIPMKEWKINI